MNQPLYYNENLFYNKIWKNIVIRNKIIKYLSFGKRRFGVIRFEKVISTSFFIKNGYFQQLRDKIKNNEYFVFNDLENDGSYGVETNSKTFNLKTLSPKKILNNNSIFNKEKAAIHWDSKFYIDLFKNYSNYFLNFNINETENILIHHDNQLALKVLHENFNHKLQIDSFIKSFLIGSYECSFYIFEKLKLIKSNSLITKIWNSLFEDINNSMETTITSTSTTITVSDIEKENLKIIEKFKFILDKLKLPLPNTQLPIPHFFNIKIYKSKLSLILESVKIIIKIKPLLNKFINFINDKSYKLKTNVNIMTTTTTTSSIITNENKEKEKLLFLKELENLIKMDDIKLVELDEINSMKFSNEDLSKYIMDIDLNENENILKLYNILLPFTNHYHCFLENKNYYQIKYKNEYQYYSIYKYSTISSSRINSKMFGHYNYNDLIEMNYSDDSLFKFCKNDRKVQLKFMKSLSDDLKSKKIINIHIIEKLMSHFININDLEFSRLIIDIINADDNEDDFKKINNREGTIIKLKRNFISSAKSIEMFDLIYKDIIISNLELNQQLISSTFQILINNNKSIILEHFKNNYPLEYYSSIDKLNLINSGVNFDVYKFIYDNINDYISNYDMIDVWKVSKLNITIDQFIYLVERTPINKSYHCLNDKLFFNYIVLNLPLDIECGRCIVEQPQRDLYNYFKIYNSNETNDLSNLQNELTEFIERLNFQYYIYKSSSIYNIVIYDIITYGNIELLDLILLLYKRNQNPRYWGLLKHIILTICEIGQLPLLKYIISKVKEDLLFLEDELYNISFRLGHIEFLEYTLNYFQPPHKIEIYFYGFLLYNYCFNHFRGTKNKYLDIKKNINKFL
ncbi:hypothetical protein RB653_009110 [Dictyostelium firmibasis]|uniref:Uncharacterized protein n=1 Tax=Dictyostelium firmibasis TaxID=79012 RepID=A0AAN7YX41_9MYCE